MQSYRMVRTPTWVVSLFVIVLLLVSSAGGQSTSLHAPPLDLAPSNSLGLPGSSSLSERGTEIIPISSGMLGNYLPKIPNLEFGFNYLFGKNLRQSHWTVDYLLPVNLWSNDLVFGEFHGDFQSYKSGNWVPFLNNFWNLTAPGIRSRVDLAFGAGYRRIFRNDLLLGANAFYDATSIFGNWRSSGGFGIEMAANGPGVSAFDLNFNYYSDVYGDFNSRGSFFPTFNIVDNIRKGSGNFDLEAGYSTPVFDRALDMRLKVTGYQYDFGNERKPGWKTGGEVTTANGVFRASIEYGHDGVFGSYGIVGGYVKVGLQLDKLLTGESPFVAPEQVFRSPRNFSRYLILPVKRIWQKPSSLVANAACEGTPDDSLFQLAVDQSGFYKGYSPGLVAFMTFLGFKIVTDTEGGKLVNAYVAAHPGGGSAFYTRDQEPMFKCMSAAYARAARGKTVVLFRLGTYSNHTSIFYQIELPALLANPNVTEIKVYEANVDPPDANPAHWDERPPFK